MEIISYVQDNSRARGFRPLRTFSLPELQFRHKERSRSASITADIFSPELRSFSAQKVRNDFSLHAFFRLVGNGLTQSGIDWMESAILFESGARKLVDKAVVVTAPLEVRIQRVMLRDSITREKALQWVSCQWSQEEVKAHSDYEIVNNGQADIDSQIEQLIKDLEMSK